MYGLVPGWSVSCPNDILGNEFDLNVSPGYKVIPSVVALLSYKPWALTVCAPSPPELSCLQLLPLTKMKTQLPASTLWYLRIEIQGRIKGTVFEIIKYIWGIHTSLDRRWHVAEGNIHQTTIVRDPYSFYKAYSSTYWDKANNWRLVIPRKVIHKTPDRQHRV